jgi:quercetin dioxygenase-like cupin family protein
MNTNGYIKLISSVDVKKNSILELNILPGEKTPWHYHSLFSETFEVLKGSLEVGKGGEIHLLEKGNIATIRANEKHYYHNVSNEECIITTTIDPGNKNFENALLILKGLANDGLANAAGTPRKFSDLVLFVYLSNSRMVGFQKLAEPVFNLFAKVAIKNGRLNELVRKYCELDT